MILRWCVLGIGPKGFVMGQPPPYPGPPVQLNQMQQSSDEEGHASDFQSQPAFNLNTS